MATINDLINQSKSMSMEQRVNIAHQATDAIIVQLKKLEISTEAITAFLINIFKLFVSGDKKTRKDEYILFKTLFNLDIDTDTFFDLTNYGSDEKFVAQIDDLVDSSPNEVAVAVATLGILIITADGEVTDSEKALLERIMKR